MIEQERRDREMLENYDRVEAERDAALARVRELEAEVAALKEVNGAIEGDRVKLWGEVCGFRAEVAAWREFGAAHEEHEDRYYVYGVNQSSGFYESRDKVIDLRHEAISLRNEAAGRETKE